MKKRLLVGLVTGLFLTGMVGGASATVLTFDDYTTTTTTAHLNDGYGGFNWSEFGVIFDEYHFGSGYDNGTVSGDYTAYNEYDNMAVASGSEFDFNGAFFTSAWDRLNIINVKGYNSGSLIYSASFEINNQTPVWHQFDWVGVDSLSFDTTGWHFAMDNFTFNENAPVPEPATMLLFGTGLAGLVGLRRRKSKK